LTNKIISVHRGVFGLEREEASGNTFFGTLELQTRKIRCSVKSTHSSAIFNCNWYHKNRLMGSSVLTPSAVVAPINFCIFHCC